MKSLIKSQQSVMPNLIRDLVDARKNQYDR